MAPSTVFTMTSCPSLSGPEDHLWYLHISQIGHQASGRWFGKFQNSQHPHPLAINCLMTISNGWHWRGSTSHGCNCPWEFIVSQSVTCRYVIPARPLGWSKDDHRMIPIYWPSSRGCLQNVCCILGWEPHCTNSSNRLLSDRGVLDLQPKMPSSGFLNDQALVSVSGKICHAFLWFFHYSSFITAWLTPRCVRQQSQSQSWLQVTSCHLI